MSSTNKALKAENVRLQKIIDLDTEKINRLLKENQTLSEETMKCLQLKSEIQLYKEAREHLQKAIDISLLEEKKLKSEIDRLLKEVYKKPVISIVTSQYSELEIHASVPVVLLTSHQTKATYRIKASTNVSE